MSPQKNLLGSKILTNHSCCIEYLGVSMPENDGINHLILDTFFKNGDITEHLLIYMLIYDTLYLL